MKSTSELDERDIREKLERMMAMFSWKDYQVAEARRQQLMDEAAGQRQLAQSAAGEGMFATGLRFAGNTLGALLVDLGTRMQTCSEEVAESLQYAQVGTAAAAAKRAEQNC